LTKYIRRLQKIGSTILVSLPKEWVTANKLQKSTAIELETGQNSISINVNPDLRPSKAVHITYPLPKQENIVANITGAYLLGYDLINIKGKTSIPVSDREKIRTAIRRLVGIEIIEEDATNINLQFLLDATSLNPKKILKRMSSIGTGMFHDVVVALVSNDRSNLQTLVNRDDEVDRQYFLLVRLIRSTLIDTRLANIFNLENIDVLDYRIAGHLLETACDTNVEISKSIESTTLSSNDLKKIYEIVKDAESIHNKTINAFISNNRLHAIEAIKLHRKYQEKISKLRLSIEKKKEIPIDFLDLVYMFEKITQSWSDVADLVKPVYPN